MPLFQLWVFTENEALGASRWHLHAVLLLPNPVTRQSIYRWVGFGSVGVGRIIHWPSTGTVKAKIGVKDNRVILFLSACLYYRGKMNYADKKCTPDNVYAEGIKHKAICLYIFHDESCGARILYARCHLDISFYQTHPWFTHRNVP